MNREVVRELIQHECNAKQIKEELAMLLVSGSKRQKVLEDYELLRNILGGGGASNKVAQSLLKTIR